MTLRHAIDGLDDAWLLTTQEPGSSGRPGLRYEVEVARLNRVRFNLDFEVPPLGSGPGWIKPRALSSASQGRLVGLAAGELKQLSGLCG